ncbi:MAG: hypothetical protein NC093_03855 [Alistipes sp.]|nr:hypothetical protein [Alistipes sp.]
MAEIKDIKDIKGDAEERDPKKRRDLIKNILIIFLIILLLLTFFSNTIMNKSLPEIQTQRATSGKLTERIRGSGVVESNQSFGVKVDGNRVINTINVKAGQEIEKGDVLLVVGTGESEELTAAEDELEALELSYQKALLTPPKDYAAENQAIKNAREDLNEAIAKKNSAAANQGNVAAAKDAYNYNKSQLEYYTSLQTKLSSVIAAIDADDYTGAPPEYTGQLIEQKNAAADAESAYNSAKEIYTALLGAYSGDQASGGDDPVAQPLSGSVVTKEELDAAEADMLAKEAACNAAKESYDSLKYSLRNDLAYQLTDAESNVSWYSAQIMEYESGGSGEEMTPEMLEEDVKSKQRTLEDLILQLSQTQQENGIQNQINQLDLQAQKKDIEKAKDKVDKLKKENETTEIKAEHNGIVSSINFRVGDETVPDMDIMTIDIAEEGYTVEITVDGEKTKKVKKGVAAEIVNNWSGNVEAVLTEIKNDTVPNSKNRILVFSVTGDIDSGTYVDLSIPCGSGSYDTIVPKSAVYSDNQGSFVLVVESKSSPLGNRYYARRVPVEVIVSDEMSSAVQGSFSSGDYIITASSKPVKPNDQVRMKDE